MSSRCTVMAGIKQLYKAKFELKFCVFLDVNNVMIYRPAVCFCYNNVQKSFLVDSYPIIYINYDKQLPFD